MLDNLSQRASRLRRLQAETSVLAFTRIYLSEHASKPPSKAHEGIYGLLMELSRKRGGKLAIAAPRGFGKSTLVTLAYVLYGICYGKEKFIVLVSSTASQAMQLLEAVKRELTANPKLLEDFPELAGPSPRPWTRSEIVTATRIRVLALGSGQRIRGRKDGKDRPTLIIADDLENAEDAFSVESREQLGSWFSGSVLMAGGERANFIFIGTLYHMNCLLAEYLDPKAHPEWGKRVYKAISSWASRRDLWDRWAQIYHSREEWEKQWGPEAARKYYEANKKEMDEGTAVLWPERWTYYGLMVQYEDNPISFNSELQNEPLNPKDSLFNEFIFWDEEFKSVDALLRVLGENVEFYGACDPSLGRDTVRGDYTAIIILARDRKTNLLYVVEADIRRYTPTQTIEAIFAYHHRYHFQRFAIETNQFQELLAQEMERRGREIGHYVPVEGVKHTGNKIGRIQSLHPWVRSGNVRFSSQHALLIEQMRYFPRGRYDDGPDALQMAVELAGQGSGAPGIFIIRIDDADEEVGWKGVNWQEIV